MNISNEKYFIVTGEEIRKIFEEKDWTARNGYLLKLITLVPDRKKEIQAESLEVLERWLSPDSIEPFCDSYDDWYGYGFSDSLDMVGTFVKKLKLTPEKVIERGKMEGWLK